MLQQSRWGADNTRSNSASVATPPHQSPRITRSSASAMTACHSPLAGVERRAYTSDRVVIMTTKETVLAVLNRLPDDCTLDDVQYQLYVTQAVAAGMADAEAGRTIPHEQVEAELRRKWQTGSEQ